jgi:predicted anti-sigma-YlaC factor YlaD
MKNRCKRTREKWKECKRKGLPDVLDQLEMREHLQTCNSCQAYTQSEGLSLLLEESYKENPPEPSPDFFTNLERKLKAYDTQDHRASISQIVLEKGWRLVPVMTILIIFLMGSIGYQYSTLSKLTARSSFEETILFEDSGFEEGDVLSAIVGWEVINGK